MSNPIRMFTSDQINKATNHFDPNCSLPELSSKYSYLWFTLYKGVIDGRSYVIKRFTKKTGVEGEETTYNDFVLSLRVSNHSFFPQTHWFLSRVSSSGAGI